MNYIDDFFKGYKGDLTSRPLRAILMDYHTFLDLCHKDVAYSFAECKLALDSKQKEIDKLKQDIANLVDGGWRSKALVFEGQWGWLANFDIYFLHHDAMWRKEFCYFGSSQDARNVLAKASKPNLELK
jgi:hypothetical protein